MPGAKSAAGKPGSGKGTPTTRYRCGPVDAQPERAVVTSRRPALAVLVVTFAWVRSRLPAGSCARLRSAGHVAEFAAATGSSAVTTTSLGALNATVGSPTTNTTGRPEPAPPTPPRAVPATNTAFPAARGTPSPAPGRIGRVRARIQRLDAMKYTTTPINARTSLSTNVE